MDFLNWLIVHLFCIVVFIFLYRKAYKLLYKLEDKQRKVSHVLLLVAMIMYALGYLTPITAYTMFSVAYIIIIAVLVLEKYNKRIRKIGGNNCEK